MHNFINGRTRGILLVIHYIDLPQTVTEISLVCVTEFFCRVLWVINICASPQRQVNSLARDSPAKGLWENPAPFTCQKITWAAFSPAWYQLIINWRGKERAWEKKKTCTYLTTWHIRILYDLKNKVFKDPTENGTDLNRILVSVHFGGTGH